MSDWLTIQLKKGKDVCLKKFIQANPVLDATMRTLLANYLNLSEPNVQKWIQNYQRAGSEHSQSYINHIHSVHWINIAKKMTTTFNVSKAFMFVQTYTPRPF